MCVNVSVPAKLQKKKKKKDGGVHCVVFSVALFFSSFCNACTGNLIKFLVW